MFLKKLKFAKLAPELVLLTIIFLIGSFLRLYRLDLAPPALNWDEASHGYNAFSILASGRDEWGNKFPTIFRAFGDFKLPVYIYLTTIPVKLFGLTAFAVRFISALAGSLAIVGVYWLVNNLFPQLKYRLGKNSFSLGLVSAFILAFLPWHFFISRPALEANLSLSFIIFGFAALKQGQKHSLLTTLGLLLLGLSLHTYNSARVFVPLLLIVWFFLQRRQLKLNPGLVFGILIFAISLALMTQQVISGSALARYQKLTLLNPGVVYQIGQSRLASTLPEPLPRLIYNRPVYFLLTLGRNYLNFFTPQFIYQSSGAQWQFAIPGMNLFGLPVLILAILGLVICSKRQRLDRSYTFLIAWLLLAPLPAALTADPPQALRPLYMIIPVAILASFGLGRYLAIFEVKPRLKLACAFIAFAVITLAFAKYWRVYWQIYRTEFAASWQDGYQQMYDFVLANNAKYDKIIITKVLGEPHIYLAFYGQLPPRQLWPESDNIRFFQSDWYWTDKIGKYYFVNDWNLTPTIDKTVKLESGQEIRLEKTLIIASPSHLPLSASKIKQIIGQNGLPVFDIGVK